MPSVIPVGYSKVSHFITCPSASGARDSVVTYGLHTLPDSAACVAVHDFFAAFWDEVGAHSTTLVRTEMRDSVTAVEHLHEDNGGVAGDFGAPQVALLVRKLSGLVGKTNRGRIYLPFSIPSTHIVDGGTIDGDTVTARQASVTTWFEAVTTDGALGDMVILHGTLDQAPTVIINWAVESVVATQKRRVGRS